MEKILFRWHRSTLEESMSTVVEISSFSELKELINEEYPLVFTRDIKIDYYGFDTRTGWENYIVLVNDSPVGWLNNQLIPNNEFNDVKTLKLELLKVITSIGSETVEDRLGLVDEIITIFSYVNKNCQCELDINEYVDISKLI
ncbi:hypothetical protein [Chryseobacterium oncorhynchi]|uniref:Uncharacterized protein n=1 Tax=Chryseobacterium oncorhynchi TaxID=741074 RepID=A0A316WN82_9FLAO|nr:hypothetical protein [Chryseobacterium oncorhynchi]PWN59990.1 hypothetical protein C1638_020700 [Chryseobacterium oncorhynchi]